MKIAIFGTTGQVATELQRRVPEGTDLTCFGRDRADFSEPEAVARVAASLTADTVVNAVAYTAGDRAESEPDLAHAVNAASVARLAGTLADRGIPLIHISTDYVFDGSGETPWVPDAPKGPLSVYGATKLAGEDAIRASGVAHTILRTSWVFSAHGANFVKSMLRLGAERDRLTIVADQVGGPTPASAIADAIFGVARGMADGAASGTHHFSGQPDTSWAGFAREIFAQSGLDCAVVDIPTTDYPTPATRPLNSRLDCGSLGEAFGIPRPDWRRELETILKELT